MKFDVAVSLIINFEGGYVNDANDPGGETKFGISKRSFPNVSIRDLSLEQAKRHAAPSKTTMAFLISASLRGLAPTRDLLSTRRAW